MSVSKEFLDKMYRRLGEARSSLAHHKAVKDFPGDGYSEKVHAAETHLLERTVLAIDCSIRDYIDTHGGSATTKEKP